MLVLFGSGNGVSIVSLARITHQVSKPWHGLRYDEPYRSPDTYRVSGRQRPMMNVAILIIREMMSFVLRPTLSP